MKTLTTILLASLCIHAQGYVVIWKSKITVTQTGGGTVAKRLLSGYIVYDTDDGSMAQVLSESSRRNFWVQDLSTFDLSDVKTTQGKTYTVFTQATTDYDDWGNVVLDFTCAKGLDSSLDIGDPIYNWIFPKTLQVTGRSMYSDSSGLPVLEESSGTLLFDQPDSKQMNVFQKNLDGAIQSIRDYYTGKGYTEL
jgi:hypothetical protein